MKERREREEAQNKRESQFEYIESRARYVEPVLGGHR